jgi:hypothetical protein
MMFFGGVFVAYTIYRAAYPEGSLHRDLMLGEFNTVVVLYDHRHDLFCKCVAHYIPAAAWPDPSVGA